MLALGSCNSFDRPSPEDVGVAPSIEPPPMSTPIAARKPQVGGFGGARFTGTGGTDANAGGAPPLPPLPAAPKLDFAKDALPSGKEAASVLYSWTTAAQVAELRANPVLLTRSESSGGARPQVSGVIERMATNGNALAQRLNEPRFRKGRFAWINPWATVRGWPGESYGDQLLRVVIKPEALMVILSADTLDVRDMQNQSVDHAIAIAKPERIAAVYFVNEGGQASGTAICGGSFVGCAPNAYREYFLNNESMIQDWSVSTPEILDELRRSIEFTKTLRANAMSLSGYYFGTDCSFSGYAYCTWIERAAPGTSLARDYVRSLALTSPFYQPSEENLAELQRVLEAALFEPDPFRHEP